VDEILKAVEELKLTNRKNTFIFSHLYQAYIGEDSAQNILNVFGKSLFWRLRNHYRNLRHFKFQSSLEMSLPDDSVIFFKKDKNGFIVASLKENIALKIFLNPHHVELLEAEIAILKKIRQTSFQSYTATLLDEGTTLNNARWMKTSYLGNALSLQNVRDPDEYLLAHFKEIVLPGLTEYYRVNGFQIIPLSDWISEVEKRIKKHPSSNKLQTLLDELAKESLSLTELKLLRSHIHHDLHAGNILRDERGAALIDWEGGISGLVVIDFLDFIRRFIKKHPSQRKHYQALLTKKHPLPPHLRLQHEIYRNWLQEKFSITPYPDTDRLEIIIYVIERSLILYEARKLDRFDDKKGIENFVFKFVEKK
jgi:thiamine kinase-like enzyme